MHNVVCGLLQGAVIAFNSAITQSPAAPILAQWGETKLNICLFKLLFILNFRRDGTALPKRHHPLCREQ